MKKVILFAGSNSSTSINKVLINFTATQLQGVETEVIDLRDYEPPMFSLDLEKEVGSHEAIKRLVNKLQEADGIVLSTPEHNGMPTAFLKNILDWLSRTARIYRDGQEYLDGKSVFLMSTAPGNGGGLGARNLVAKMIGYAKANIVSEFTLPRFGDNFDGKAIVDQDLSREFSLQLKSFTDSL